VNCLGGEIEFYAKYADIYELQFAHISDDVEFWVKLAKRFPKPVLEPRAQQGKVKVIYLLLSKWS